MALLWRLLVLLVRRQAVIAVKQTIACVQAATGCWASPPSFCCSLLVVIVVGWTISVSSQQHRVH